MSCACREDGSCAHCCVVTLHITAEHDYNSREEHEEYSKAATEHVGTPHEVPLAQRAHNSRSRSFFEYVQSLIDIDKFLATSRKKIVRNLSTRSEESRSATRMNDSVSGVKCACSLYLRPSAA